MAIVNLALFQARSISLNWAKEQQDCAGLIRFVYKEAIKKRTIKQRNNLKLPEKLNFPGVSNAVRNIFPFFPDIWKISATHYSSFADAENLVMFNFDYVSKNINDLMPGDLLVFNIYFKNHIFQLPSSYYSSFVELSLKFTHLLFRLGHKSSDVFIRISFLFEVKTIFFRPTKSWDAFHDNYVSP